MLEFLASAISIHLPAGVRYIIRLCTLTDAENKVDFGMKPWLCIGMRYMEGNTI